LNDPIRKAEIQKAAFESALIGIRKGVMTYEKDPLLPIVQQEIENRTKAYAGLSAAEEGAMLSLTNE
jgi:hypothetical protein